ncbi:MAG: hypothetical protein IJ228_06620 [Succinivibrio sp.]|nr:hypothetical protein [Succinivibrio sp.]
MLDPNCKNPDVIGHLIVEIEGPEEGQPPIPVKLVWLKSWANEDKILCILSTDITLSDEVIVRNYEPRFNIEECFFNMKHFLRLESGSRARLFDSIVAHFALTCIRLILLTVMKCHDPEHTRSIGEMHYQTTEEVREKPLADVIKRIVNCAARLPQKLIENHCIVPGKEIETLKIILEALKECFTDLPLYVAQFVTSSTAWIKEQLLACEGGGAPAPAIAQT